MRAGRVAPALGLSWALFLAVGPAALRAQLPPDTIQAVRVDSTQIRIRRQLEALARPPGVDSTWFLPDSLLPDSLREARQAVLGRSRGGGLQRPAPSPSPTLGSGDSIMMALSRLEGFTLTEYSSQGADFNARTRLLMLLGTPEQRARLIRGGEEMTADTALVYSEETGKIWSLGSEATFQPKDGDPVTSRRIVFDLNQERGTALGARTQYSGAGATWLVHGDLRSVSESASYGTTWAFTTCDLDEPHYHFQAREVKLVRDDVMVARGVRLFFADVPVFWLPFMAQSMDQNRASGLLTPTFSVNDIVRTSRGYRRRLSNLGFYWAMSDYNDLTAYLDWWSGEHLSLTGSMRYEWSKQFLSGGLNLRQFWREEGGTELALDASNSWQPTERTNLRFQVRYASSSSFVRRTSFDPMEVVQSIDSDGGLSHRFSFGNLSLAANRRQYLTDDRVEMTLPTLSFSLSPRTFFKASSAQTRFYNNMTWSGSANYRRSLSDRPEQPDTAVFTPSQADQVSTSAGFNTGLTMGNLSLSGGMTLRESVTLGVPLTAVPGTDSGGDPVLVGREDQGESDLGWNLSLGYQQRLVGSTTLTPSLSVSGQLLRSDTDSLANAFVSAPRRLSFGVSLNSELYGFFPGFARFDAIRHKITPGFDFSYSPEVSPTETQAAVFGSRAVGALRTLGVSLNQTFEARLKEEAAAERAASMQEARKDSLTVMADSLRVLADSLSRSPLDPTGASADSLRLVADSLETEALTADTTGAARAQREAAKVTLLALRTSAVSYDFERAAEEGNWLRGFSTTKLNNNISSDFLRGLSLNVTHDLFEDQAGVPGGEGSTGSTRRFAPHLEQANFSFSLDSNSFLFRALGALLGGGDEAASTAQASQQPGAPGGDPLGPSLSDESSVIPGGQAGQTGPRRRTGGGGGMGQWRANLSYSLQRPRSETLPSNQMIQGNLTFSPTAQWEVSWRTGYDVSEKTFSDHIIRLTRDLHRWQAYFDFRQTATGNWSFRFEVALMDQEDLHFDYQQRSVTEEGGIRRF